MGYFNIIDSLNDVKVNEGMTESIPKNKNKDSDKLVKALQSCDIDFIPDKYIKCYKSFYNRSSFSKNFVDNVIKWTGMLKNKSNNGAKLYMLCLGDGGRFFMVFEAPRFSRLARCFVFKVPDEVTMESLFELANDGNMTFDIDNPKLDGCKLIADTYCIHDVFTDDVLNTVVDAKAEVYVARLYSKLKLPTLGCRLTITFDSTKSAKSTLKSLDDVKNWVNSLKVVGTSLVVEVY